MALRLYSTHRRLRLYVFTRDPAHTNTFAMRAPSDRDSETDVCVLSHHSTRRRLRRLVFTIDLRALTRPSPTYPPARAIPQRLTMALCLYSIPQRLRLYVLVLNHSTTRPSRACLSSVKRLTTMFSSLLQYSPTSPAVSIYDRPSRADSTRPNSCNLALDPTTTDDGSSPTQYSPTSPAVRIRA
jgi:hypothetical protein